VPLSRPCCTIVTLLGASDVEIQRADALNWLAGPSRDLRPDLCRPALRQRAGRKSPGASGAPPQAKWAGLRRAARICQGAAGVSHPPQRTRRPVQLCTVDKGILMLIAVYPGTFDPITRGHEDLVRRAVRLFDEVVVAVAESRNKRPFFDMEERVAMTREVLADVPRVRVEGFLRPAYRLCRRAGCSGGAARTACRVGLRIRVPAGRDEPHISNRISRRFSSPRRISTCSFPPA
jgi:cytidyltransferase-like protein